MGVYLGRNKVDMLGGTPIALNGNNTSDATVTENDLAKDVIAYGANGRIVGKTPTIKNGVFSKAANCSVHSNAKEYVSVDLMCESDMLLRGGSGLFYNIDSSRFGNAKKEEVLSGVTFTSSSGLLEEGTLVVKEEEIGNYEYTSNGSKTITPSNGKVFSQVNVNINVPSNGIDTSDATATASDMADGVTAYVNGEKVTGNVQTITDDGKIYGWKTGTPTTLTSDKSIGVKKKIDDNDVLYRMGSTIFVSTPPENFGDAQPSDVVKGKIFTSVAGLKATGTYEPSTGLDTSDATATASDMAEGTTAYVNGEKITGNVATYTGSLFVDENNTPAMSSAGNFVIRHIFDEQALLRKNANIQLSISGTAFGTATASDVAQGVTFTSASGLKVEGELEEINEPESCLNANNYDLFASGTTVCTRVFADEDCIIRKDSGLWADIEGSYFGTATADKVLEGVTFTGADGFKKTGTMKASSGVTLPDGAVVVQKVIGAEASTQVGSGYSLSVTYGDSVEINDSLALAFVGSTSTLSNISATTDFSVLQGKYIRTGSSASSYKYYYIPDGSTFTVGGQSYNKTLTCNRAQQVTIQKVSL